MRLNKKRYLRQGGVRCPYCNGYDINTRSSDIRENGEMFQVVECLDCELKWEELYRLTDIRRAV